MNKNIYILLILFLSFKSSQAQDSIVVMSLKEALQTGLDSSKSLKISSAKMQLAEARYNQAVDATIPSLKFAGNYSRLSFVEEPKFTFPGSSEAVSLFPVYVNNYSAGLTLSETIFSGFRLKYAKESQKLLRDAAAMDLANDRNEIAFDIVQAFYNLYKLQASQELVDKNIELTKQRVRDAELALKNGLATKNDVLRWQLQQSNLELTKIDIANNIEIANYDLNLMLGMKVNKKIIPDVSSINDLLQVKSIDEYFNQSTISRSDLAAAEMRSRASYNAMKVAGNSYLPRVSVAGEILDARPNPRWIPPVDVAHTSWMVGVNLNWDLVSLYSNRHNVDEQKSLYRQTVEGQNLINDAAKSEINRNYFLFTEAQQKAKVMETSVAQSAENFRLMDSRYKNSLVLLTELLEANNQLLSAQINLAMAKADIQVAYYRLQKSTGSIK
jgi:outer membrane protein